MEFHLNQKKILYHHHQQFSGGQNECIPYVMNQAPSLDDPLSSDYVDSGFVRFFYVSKSWI